MGLAISNYPDQDYYAVIGGASINGRVLDEEGKGVGGVRVNITGPQKLFAVTEPSGMYTAIDIKEGSYVVSLNKKGFCVDNGISVSRKTCTPSKRVTAGNAEVTFTKLGKNSIEGSIEDQWDRRIAGIEVKIAGDGMEQSEYTDEFGRYQLGVDGDGPFTVTPVPAGRGPSEHYYLMQDEAPTKGISAEVKFNRKIGTATVDWELDRTLEMRGGRVAAEANGHARMDYDLEVITQVGTRVPEGVQLRISNAAGGDPQSAVTCVGSKQVLPNKDFGGTEIGTNADGLVQFTIYPGETPVFYAVLIRLVDDPNSDRYFSPYWAFATPANSAGTLPVGEQLNADIRESINQAYAGAQPEPMPTDPVVAVDWLVHLQENAPRIKGLSFGPVHGANGAEAVAVWPMGKPPKVNPDGSIVESADVRILDQKLFVNAYPTLPTVSEWALGSANVPAHGTVLRGSAADPGNAETFFGWPMAIYRNSGLKGCIGPHPNDYSHFVVTPSGDSRVHVDERAAPRGRRGRRAGQPAVHRRERQALRLRRQGQPGVGDRGHDRQRRSRADLHAPEGRLQGRDRRHRQGLRRDQDGRGRRHLDRALRGQEGPEGDGHGQGGGAPRRLHDRRREDQGDEGRSDHGVRPAEAGQGRPGVARTGAHRGRRGLAARGRLHPRGGRPRRRGRDVLRRRRGPDRRVAPGAGEGRELGHAARPGAADVGVPIRIVR